MTPELLEQALHVAPFHQWLGVSLRESGPDGITIAMPWREEMISNPALPAMHGGVLAALIDLTGFYTVLAAGHVCTSTADIHVDYHRPASRESLTARGIIVRIGKRLSVAEVRVSGETGKLLASGRGAYAMKG
ncbi:MAG: PaaI family thioesterase [Qipengyuania sp.]|nr:PaaI family thioesterase [Qipengyuania sp.]